MSGNIHAPHPKCTCGKSLYKCADKGGQPKKSDPYIYCRNPNCTSTAAALATMKATLPEVVKKVPDASVAKHLPLSRSEQIARNEFKEREESKKPPKPVRKAIPATEAPPPDNEVVRAARAKIAVLIQSSAAEAGLILALLNQGTGHLAEANAIIKEFDLEAKFGLKQF